MFKNDLRIYYSNLSSRMHISVSTQFTLLTDLSLEGAKTHTQRSNQDHTLLFEYISLSKCS